MDQDAIESLREALKFSPENIPLRLHLANTLMRGNAFQEAEKEFLETLKIDNRHVEAQLGLARAYVKQLKYPLATIVLEELMDQDPNNLSARALHVECLMETGELSSAIEHYRQILEIDANYTNPKLDSKLRMNSQPEQSITDEDGLRVLEKPSSSFDDVGGMEREKEEISMKIIQPLNHPELYKAYGKKIGGGILFYGPPGCGKTHLARATAGQIDANFINVGINDVLDMWIGNSEKNLHQIFELARNNKPCVLFFDEIDALGANRSDMRQSTGRTMINQFLSELDGLENDNDGILILGATNAPWHLDPAFRRPGRFDRIIFVGPPSLEARTSILDIMVKGKPAEKLDLNTVAKKAVDYSGADLNAVIDIAIEEKLKSSFKTGIPEPLETKDLLMAIKKHRPSVKEWFNTAKNYALYSNEGGVYDDILTYLNLSK